MQRLLSSHQAFWDKPMEEQDLALALEEGRVLFFPKLPFLLDSKEEVLLTPTLLKQGSKNISYDLNSDQLKGVAADPVTEKQLHRMMQRFAQQTQRFVSSLYGQLIVGRTSFRPAEIAGRQVPSYRKDDTRLHVDAFPATPTGGQRILRFFSNIHFDKPRVWRLGESFEKVARRFMPQIRPPFPLSRAFLQRLRITKHYRSLYDHYMLQIHDRMKADQDYQKNADQEVVGLPGQSSWLVFTDQVSHAALSGQYLLEQSFYLPVSSQSHPECSPLRVLENYCHRPLV